MTAFFAVTVRKGVFKKTHILYNDVLVLMARWFVSQSLSQRFCAPNRSTIPQQKLVVFGQKVVGMNTKIRASALSVLLFAVIGCTVYGSMTDPGASSPTTVFAVNCGADGYTSSDGTEYAPDTGYSGGLTSANSESISGTTDDTLYQSERYGNFTYSVAVPNGQYLVTLHFAETSHSEAGLRSFDVLMEGTEYISSLDVYAEVGGNAAYTSRAYVTVSDKVLNIEFVSNIDDAMINAIKVSPTGPSAEFSYSPNKPLVDQIMNLDASASTDPDGTIAAYSWSFGDGSSGTGKTTTHTYSAAGQYHVTLTVTDNDGETDSVTMTITVYDADARDEGDGTDDDDDDVGNNGDDTVDGDGDDGFADEGLVAFPGAEGYGKVATGGRGGKVYEVTNLNSSGSGSFGDAIGASGPRTVVFRVGGTIKGGFTISNDDITIAGQTAPGDGIAIHGSLGINANNVIIRYIRVRGTGSGDSITNNHGTRLHTHIYDHISTNWSSDEVMSIYFSEHVTIQYCMITEACSSDHKFGGIWGGDYNSYHHNLFAHNTDRTPRIASGSGHNDVRNNVIYNWANLGTYGCEAQQVGDSSHAYCATNAVANYYKPGPGTPDENKTRIISPTSRDGADDYGDWYVADNYLDGYPDVTADNWLGVIPHYWGVIERDVDAAPGLRLDTPTEHMPIRQQTAEEAYLTVLEQVGCSLPNRDSLDERIIEEVRTGTANGSGFISSPGSLPTLQDGTAPVDSDHDGMPDEWELAKGLDPNDDSDRNNTDSIGYTMLENYLNSIDGL